MSRAAAYLDCYFNEDGAAAAAAQGRVCNQMIDIGQDKIYHKSHFRPHLPYYLKYAGRSQMKAINDDKGWN